MDKLNGVTWCCSTQLYEGNWLVRLAIRFLVFRRVARKELHFAGTCLGIFGIGLINVIFFFNHMCIINTVSLL